MLPFFPPGQKLLVQTWFVVLVVGDVVICKDPRSGRMIVKRIAEVRKTPSGYTYFVCGDNREESTDSRIFGWISRSHIVGKVIYSQNV